MTKIQLTTITILMFFNLFGQSSGDSFQNKKEKFSKTIMKENWDEPDKILKLIEPAIYLEEGKIEKIGCSKLGGQPDLPKSIQWPKFDNKSMVFYGQINFEEISKIYPESELPKNGILYFFSYFNEPENEFGAEYEFIKSKSEYSVIYYENINDDLLKTEFPKDLINKYRFKVMPLKFELEFQIPPTIETSKVELSNLSKNDIQKIDSYIDENQIYEIETILGTPYPIQYGADYDWAYSYLGITDFNKPGIQEEIAKVKPYFINLLSFSMINRFEEIGNSFCYFGIHLEDLKNKKFEKTVFIMQGT